MSLKRTAHSLKQKMEVYMKVKDVMVKDVRHLSPEITAKDALYKILNQHISGLPVIDEKGTLVGMFTEKDVLKYILPSYIEQVGKFMYGETPKSVLNKLKTLDKIKVKDLMRKEVVTISTDSDLAEAAHLILTQKARRVLVVDNGKIMGIIAREDIVRALASEAGFLRRERE